VSAGNRSTAAVTTTPQQLARIAGFIWGIADDVLRDLYVRGKYRDVILPMTVLRRFDAVLEPTKQAVLEMKALLDKEKIVEQDSALRDAAGQAVYNTSKFTLRDLRSRTSQQQLRLDFEAYLDGFSPNVQEILDAFEFRNQIPRLSRADAIGTLIEKFLDPSIDLSPAGLDNHAMGTLFEELVRRFNEENNEEAGEHWTPRDAVKLMASLIFLPIADEIESGTYLIYDGACGTGGMLTVAEDTVLDLAAEHGKDVSIHLYGQEINSETYAIAKADLLLKGEGEAADNIVGGPEHSTLSNDAFPSREFDFMLSNPPYGKSWKGDLERMGGKSGMKDPRFVVEHDGDPEFSLVTRSSDGQLLFLANLVSKMKHATKLGSRIAEVHNGSSLFTGDAGQGESNIRRWIIENDWLEAIVALPLNMFYNTGIATYVWVLTNRKPEHRRGKVQLIDATKWFEPLRKNLGKKNCRLSGADIDRICETFLAFAETEESRIFPNEHFGHRKVTVERPLRLKSQFTKHTWQKLQFASGDEVLRSDLYEALGETLFEDFGAIRSRAEDLLTTWMSGDEEHPGRKITDAQRSRLLKAESWARDKLLVDLSPRLLEEVGSAEFVDHNEFRKEVDKALKRLGVTLPATAKKAIHAATSRRSEHSPPVIGKIHTRSTPDPLRGLFETTIDGKTVVVEYEPDTDLRDTEQVPLLEQGGVDAFLEREVLPYAPDAWCDAASIKVGYEISFTREFYKPQPLRSLEEIRADILALEGETAGLIGEIVGAES
jgi:type I restriction enzyme M protein